jgi:hypothetical protein
VILHKPRFLFAGSTVTEICLGTGPCGELRYPAYQEKDGKWSYFGGHVLFSTIACMLHPLLPLAQEFQHVSRMP